MERARQIESVKELLDRERKTEGVKKKREKKCRPECLLFEGGFK